jgi:hypothetical protein
MIKLAFIPFVALAFQEVSAHLDFILCGNSCGAFLIRLLIGLGVSLAAGLRAIITDHF